MNAWKVTRIIEEMGADEKGMPVSWMRVEFMVGNHGPFLHRFRKAEFRPELVRQQLDQFARDVVALTS